MAKKKQPAKKISYNRKPKPVGDNESDLLSIILQSVDGLSELGKARVLSYVFAKYEKYIPLNK